MRTPPAFLLAFLLILPVATAQGHVFVVDAAGGPGSDFTQIGQATAAASDGDIVLVRTGDYRYRVFPTELDDTLLSQKGLTVVADTGALVKAYELHVQGVPAGSFALLQGLELGIQDHAVIENCLGPVWLSDVSISAETSLSASVVEVKDNAALTLVRSTLRGDPFLARSTVRAFRAPLQMFEVDLQGSAGGPAMELVDASLWLSGSNLRGGDGLDGWNATNGCNGLAGGDGLRLSFIGRATRARILDSVLARGAGGDPFAPTCAGGADGRDLVATGGAQAIFRAGQHRGLAATSPVRDDETLSIMLTGKPGDAFAVAFSWRPARDQASSAFDGPILLAAPARVFFAGTLPSSGTLTQSFAVRALPPGVEGRTGFVQAVFRDVATGRAVVSSPSAIVMLDDAF
jgi:hypothetical protein